MSRKELKEFKKRFTDLKVFQNFIDENKITSSQNFKDRFLVVYIWLRKAKLTKEVKYFGQIETVGEKENKKAFIEENFNTLEDFQNFIDQNSIGSPKELQKHFQVYNRLTQLGFEKLVKYCRDEKLTEVYEAFQKYKTPEDFQNFINDNKIVSSRDFTFRFRHVYRLFEGLGYGCEVSYYGSSKPRKNPLTATKDEINKVQNFIDSEKITSIKELRSKLGSRKFQEEIISKGIRPPVITYFGKEKKEVINLDKFNTIEKVQSYIDLHKIKTLEDFPSRVITLVQAQNFTKYLNYYNENKIDLNTLEDFNKFIEENQITGSADFDKKFPKIYRRALVFNFTSKLNYYNREVKELFTTVEQFQNLIDTENIKNPTELKIKYPGIYQRLSDFKFCHLVNYHGDIKQSNLEYEVESFLMSKGIEFEARKQQPFLTNSKSLDVYIPKYNIGIECQGDMHFIPVDFYGGEQNFIQQQKNDSDKYNECKENGTTLLYYMNPKYSRWETDKIINELSVNYFDKVYTTLNELWDKISELILEKENSDIHI